MNYFIPAYTFDGVCYLDNTIKVFDPKSSRFEMELALLYCYILVWATLPYSSLVILNFHENY